ncbi:hypothetical protein VP01_9977g1 [Puccinia sorghi]|uniref:Uncharacterized protein n=1 Tax=Puccinia sorghi TaxID=27349 RepID=A0A0L6U5R4_9BASI|nr:hypothetical protein VP01_9977g1 [Puccinia sorghi]
MVSHCQNGSSPLLDSPACRWTHLLAAGLTCLLLNSPACRWTHLLVAELIYFYLLLDSTCFTRQSNNSSPLTVKSESTESESDAGTALLTYQCKNSQHNLLAKHSKAQCFAKHPHKLAEYRKQLKD